MVKRRGNPVTTSELTVTDPRPPRHGVTVDCPACGWKLVAGGYETVQKRNDIEAEARATHAQVHSEVMSQGKLMTQTVEENGFFVQKVPPLKVSRSSHKVEAQHQMVTQTTNQSRTGATTYATPTGCSITSGSFTAGQTYLHLVTAHISGTSISDDWSIRCASGTTVHAQSEMVVEIDSAAGNRTTYMWWMVRTAVSGEDFHVEIATNDTAETVNVDQVSLTIIRLSTDFSQGTDWQHDDRIANTSISTADTDTASTNNASITLTPANASHRWLILSKARYGAGISNGTSCQSRISRSGEASDNDMVVQQEGEDTTNSCIVLCGARTDTLGASSNTYTEISRIVNTGAAFAAVTRTNSGIFMLDLDQFKNVAVNLEDTGQEEPTSSTTVHGVLVHSQAVTTQQTGDIFVLAHCTMDAGGAGATFTMRLQVNDVDEPGTQSTDDYLFNCWDTLDRVVWATHTILDNKAAATYTADIDGGITVAAGSPGTLTRLLVLFSLELAVATGISQVKNETEAITENVVRVLGTAGKQVKNETEAITESVIPIVTSTANLIQDENIVFRMSGGAANTSLAASIGGARSTAGGGIITTKLFDDVTITEASTGDTEYRCFYILNAHGSLQASSVKIWIPVNTPGQDEIDIGLGSSAVNGTEQTVANEQTAPTSVTFVQANSEGTAINCQNLPAGQHRAIWLRRVVPAQAAFFPNNTYSLQVSLYSDHS